MEQLKIELACVECKHPHQLVLNPWSGKHTWKGAPVASYGELWAIVTHYKKIKGYDALPNWDAQYKRRALKGAKQIYKFFSVVKDPLDVARECMADLAEKADREGWTWTLETVVKRAPDWLVAKQKPRRR